MASGKKNYFRHSFFAFEDEKIQRAIDLLGYEGYAYYFILLELLAKRCENEFQNPIRIHQQSVRNVWRKQTKSCKKVVEKLQESGLFVATFKESFIEFDIPNLAKYLGKYQSKIPPNDPNKIKEKKIKEKKIKVNNIGPNTKELSDHFLNEVELKEFLLRIPDYTAKEILSSYEKDVLLNKIPKAYKWHLDNGATTKRVGLFITNWLENKKYDNAHQKKEEQESAYMKLINSNPYND
jgi:hypothetical protein